MLATAEYPRLASVSSSIVNVAVTFLLSLPEDGTVTSSALAVCPANNENAIAATSVMLANLLLSLLIALFFMS